MQVKDTTEVVMKTNDTKEDESSQPRRMSIDTQSVQQGGDVRIEIRKDMLSHRVDVLKKISQ